MASQIEQLKRANCLNPQLHAKDETNANRDDIFVVGCFWCLTDCCGHIKCARAHRTACKRDQYAARCHVIKKLNWDQPIGVYDYDSSYV